jgi:hypothetical protein
MVLLAFFFVPAVYTQAIFGPQRVHVPAYAIVLRDFLFGMLPFDKRDFAGDPLKYYFTITSLKLAVIAHCYFLCTPFIVFVRASSRIGKVIRYFAMVLSFIWIYPILNYFHPLAIGVWKLEGGFYLLASGYTLAMLCILLRPKQPERGPAFPVECSPSKS